MNTQSDLIGLQIDNYLVQRLIGQGGMAAVYLARDINLDRDVVLKVMLPALAQIEEVRHRFQREARSTARLNHPNIVPIYANGSTPSGLPYIALQYIEGGSLSDHLHNLSGKGQWISSTYALVLVRQIADALAVAHRAGIVHRDLKPSNILLRQDGTPVLSDLGIAALKQSTVQLTQTGGIMGTPHYMSPEQAGGKIIDGRSDIYSLGVILYELLSGRLPFDADSPWAIIHQHIYEQPPPLQSIRPDLTPQTQSIVTACLQKDPVQRFQTVQQLTAALETAVAAENNNPRVSHTVEALALTQVDAPPLHYSMPQLSSQPFASAQPQTPAMQTKNRPFLWLLAAGILMVLILFGSFLVLRARNEANQAETVVATLQAQQTVVALGSASVEATIDDDAATATAVLLLIPTTMGASTATTAPESPTVAAPAPTATTVPESPTITAAVPDFPDGLIAYSCGPADADQIYLYDPQTGQEFRLLNQPPNSAVPAFSRDGSQISYRSNLSGAFQVYASNVDGSNFRQITSGPGNNREAVWSPDGRRIVFVSDRDGARQLYMSNLDGTNEQRLTFDSVRSDDPSWSVNGEIAYERQNEAGRYDIYQISASGGAPQLLVDVGGSTSTPAWSPDGERLAFEVTGDNETHIWFATRDGTVTEPVTAAGTRNYRPAWSPDGTRLVISSNHEVGSGEVSDIWIVDLQSQAMQRLTSSGFCVDPAWGRPNAAIRRDHFAGLSDDTTSAASTEATWPVSDTGVEACHLEIGMSVTAGDNARLWSVPDVTAAVAVADVPANTLLTVTGGPTWGLIRRDVNASGWWWQVEIPSGADSGWLWQARLRECSEA